MRNTKFGRIYEQKKEEAVKTVGIVFELGLYDLIPQETLVRIVMAEKDEEFMAMLKGQTV